MRCENDGYIKNYTHFENQQFLTLFNSSKFFKNDELLSLLHATRSITMNEKISNETIKLTIKSVDYKIFQIVIFDLKTRFARREIDIKKMYSRL